MKRVVARLAFRIPAVRDAFIIVVVFSLFDISLTSPVSLQTRRTINHGRTCFTKREHETPTVAVRLWVDFPRLAREGAERAAALILDERHARAGSRAFAKKRPQGEPVSIGAIQKTPPVVPVRARKRVAQETNIRRGARDARSVRFCRDAGERRVVVGGVVGGVVALLRDLRRRRRLPVVFSLRRLAVVFAHRRTRRDVPVLRPAAVLDAGRVDGHFHSPRRVARGRLGRLLRKHRCVARRFPAKRRPRRREASPRGGRARLERAPDVHERGAWRDSRPPARSLQRANHRAAVHPQRDQRDGPRRDRKQRDAGSSRPLLLNVWVRQTRGVHVVVPLAERVRGAERIAFGRHATPVARLPPRGRVRRGSRDASRIERHRHYLARAGYFLTRNVFVRENSVTNLVASYGPYGPSQPGTRVLHARPSRRVYTSR